MKYLAVQGCTFKAKPPAVLEAGTANVTTLPSTKVTCDGKSAYRGPITVVCPTGSITHPDFTASNGVNTAPATFTINPNGITKTKIEGQLALAPGDSGKGAVSGSEYIPNPAPPPPTITNPVVANVTIEIDDPGQSKVQSN